jgi:hypothetical protein
MWTRLRDWLKRDDDIDALIAENRATPIRGMHDPDWRRIDEIGESEWQAIADAQKRTARKE